jgi:nucleoside-diphosphate-sugar epimerase
VRATAFLELWDAIMARPIVFGLGRNSINFVSVSDVAAVVERAVLDPDLRGHTIEIGRLRNLTFNELAALLRQARGTSERVRHIPRPVLCVAAAFSRHARALAMDTTDMTFNPPRPHANQR